MKQSINMETTENKESLLGRGISKFIKSLKKEINEKKQAKQEHLQDTQDILNFIFSYLKDNTIEVGGGFGGEYGDISSTYSFKIKEITFVITRKYFHESGAEIYRLYADRMELTKGEFEGDCINLFNIISGIYKQKIVQETSIKNIKNRLGI